MKNLQKSIFNSCLLVFILINTGGVLAQKHEIQLRVFQLQHASKSFINNSNNNNNPKQSEEEFYMDYSVFYKYNLNQTKYVGIGLSFLPYLSKSTETNYNSDEQYNSIGKQKIQYYNVYLAYGKTIFQFDKLKYNMEGGIGFSSEKNIIYENYSTAILMTDKTLLISSKYIQTFPNISHANLQVNNYLQYGWKNLGFILGLKTQLSNSYFNGLSTKSIYQYDYINQKVLYDAYESAWYKNRYSNINFNIYSGVWLKF